MLQFSIKDLRVSVVMGTPIIFLSETYYISIMIPKERETKTRIWKIRRYLLSQD